MTTHGRRPIQRGASLLFALVTLAALSLAAVALVRSVDTSSLVVGNVALKQAGVAMSGRATEDAINRLLTLRAASGLDAVQKGVGYYPIAYERLDPTGNSADVARAVADWDGNDCATPYTSGTFAGGCLGTAEIPSPVSNYKVRYVITRLCTAAKPPTDAANSCAKPIDSTINSGSGRGSFGYPTGRDPTQVDPGPYYRVVVRTTGPRNSIGYTETIVHF